MALVGLNTKAEGPFGLFLLSESWRQRFTGALFDLHLALFCPVVPHLLLAFQNNIELSLVLGSQMCTQSWISKPRGILVIPQR